MHVDVKSRLPFVIAICQEKGGVGKTTTAISLGAELANHGKTCLLVDLASSGNLTNALGFNSHQLKYTTKDLFHQTYSPAQLILPVSASGLYLIPANATLATLPKELYQTPDYEHNLRKLLAHNDFLRYDVIVLDCPPNIDPLTINAVASADLALMPIVCDKFSIQSLEAIFRLINLSRNRANPNLSYRIFCNKFDQQEHFHKSVYQQIEAHYKDALINTSIGFDIKIPESQMAGVPITAYAPDSGANKQYQAFTNEIVKIINGKEEKLQK